MSLILHELHQSLGARFSELNGAETVADYGDAIAEHTALRESAGVLDFSLQKSIPLGLGEGRTLTFNADFFNVLNCPGNPNSIGGDGILKTQESGQPARELQLTLRLTW